MTNTRIAHAFPDLSEGQALLALLSETLELARDLEMTQREIKGANAELTQAIIASAGLADEIEAAEKTAHATIVEILARVSEGDLKAGRDNGLLLPEDYQEALKAMRILSLSRGHSTGREDEREV
ncbi:hypothetical protein [Magnetovibrio blakemorei]|uniref:Uncharacterized protein n=1 Tax=Magnetovibrio blakemorei TaxID=28181 RepID=A0A1E5Q3F4_9PROT|nr:hypothetical protein [Magnetovibrio blakemorei]OEJ64246.1 hypothetical protein BEN30_16895 [Magnetovibrio blakemorei]